MRRWLPFVLLLSASTTYASEHATLRELPVPTVQKVGGEDLACVNTDGWRQIMLIAVDYRGLFFWRLEIQGVLAAQEQVALAYELKVSNYENMVNVLQAERDYLGTRIKELEKAFTRRETLNKLERYVLWGLVIVESLALGTIGIVSYVQSR